MRPIPILLLLLLTFLWLQPETVRAQSAEDETLEASSGVLREIMAIPVKGIPVALLADARGVAIIPGMLKGGFVVGVRHGKGVLVTRDNAGAWRSPVFITVTGGSVGWQIGLQSTDLILVFKTQASVDGLKRGKFTIGADASVAAGPVGRQASAATDAQLKAEILSYSRSRGLFAGVAIDGAVLHIDQRATAAYYTVPPGQPPGQLPVPAAKLLEQIVQLTGPGNGPAPALLGPAPAPVVPAPGPAPFPAPGPAPVIPVPALEPPLAVQPDEREAVRQQLVKVSQQLQNVLDPQWQKYLALPTEVYVGQATPSVEKLTPFLNRYRTIAADPRYRSLAERREFQETLQLLQRLVTLPAPGVGNPPLPPPPAN